MQHAWALDHWRALSQGASSSITSRESEGVRNGDSPFVFRLLGTVTRLLSDQGGGKMPRLVTRRQGKVALES